MNEKIKIGVVEDEEMMAKLICKTLENLGYTTTKPAESFERAIDMIEKEKPDIILLDIFLNGKKDGIELAEIINKKYKIPFIFLTSNTQKETLERAKTVNPPAYLVKPFNNEELYCAIEICFNNYSKSKLPAQQKSNYLINDSFFIKDGYHFIKVKYNDIYYVESDHVYIHIHTSAKKLTIRSSLGNFIENVNNDIFYRLHRSYLINMNHIDAINTDNVIVKGVKIPTTKHYHDELLSKLKIA
jgi:two-component system response regulator LytT